MEAEFNEQPYLSYRL